MSIILKCKMCGGDVTVNKTMTIGMCQFCGSTMTLPKMTSEKRAEAFNRGNQLRRIGEFDNALTVYENIVSEDPTDAEAHWCCALSRFGIEYVEDPVSFEYIPTCHRASFESILDDIDYKAALEYSEGVTQRQYQKEARKIDEVQKSILATSQSEAPFDIFICFKETDSAGRRTVDSTLAQDIYSRLTEQGYKTFFARITLEDKVGAEYEPYIFAALNSAKVMIVIGTSRENLDSVWVKNEWSRFLSIIKKDRSKVLLPCYKNMKPEDMPEGLSVLQGYDMSAIGFEQDLIRGIEKIVKKEKKNENGSEPSSLAVLQKKLELYKENSDYDQIINVSKLILDSYPDNWDAYKALICATYKISDIDELVNVKHNFSKNKDYQMLYRLADDRLKKQLDEQNEIWKKYNSSRKKKKIAIIAGISVAIIAVAIALTNYIISEIYVRGYNKAIEYAKDGYYTEAKASLKFQNKVKENHPELYSYFDAVDLVETEDYSKAKNILDTLPEYYLNKEELLELCDAALIIDEINRNITDGKYDDAYKVVNSIISNGDSVDQKLLGNLANKHIMYTLDNNDYAIALVTKVKYEKLGVDCTTEDKSIVSKLEKNIANLYSQKQYRKIVKYTNAVNSYSNESLSNNSRIYEALANAHNNSYSISSDKINMIKNNLDVEDAKTLIMSNQNIAERFLQGTWKSGGYYFTMTAEGSTTYNLPWFDYGDYYSIEDGIYWLFKSGEDVTDGKQLYKFIVNSKDSVTVYCYKNGSSYTLTRQ